MPYIIFAVLIVLIIGTLILIKIASNARGGLQTVLGFLSRAFLVLLVTLTVFFGAFYIMLQKCCNGPSQAARTLFITTILETGQLKFLANWVCSDEEIQEIVDKNSMEKVDTTVDTSLISINTASDDPETGEENPYADEEFDENGIRIEEISGRTYFGK